MCMYVHTYTYACTCSSAHSYVQSMYVVFGYLTISDGCNNAKLPSNNKQQTLAYLPPTRPSVSYHRHACVSNENSAHLKWMPWIPDVFALQWDTYISMYIPMTPWKCSASFQCWMFRHVCLPGSLILRCCIWLTAHCGSSLDGILLKNYKIRLKHSHRKNGCFSACSSSCSLLRRPIKKK